MVQGKTAVTACPLDMIESSIDLQQCETLHTAISCIAVSVGANACAQQPRMGLTL